MPPSDGSLATDVLLNELRDLVGDRVSTVAAVREHHSRGESHHEGRLPDAVVYPLSTDEVRDIVRICARHRCPMVAFGAGSSLEGHVIPVRGGVTIDLSRMTRVLRVSTDDLDATVEAGVTRKQLERHLQSTGLTFPLDPGFDATIGGMAATRASGTTAVRYGTMRETVLGLTVVLADGRVIRTGTRARKSSAGYDLTRLFVGSEGTLGIITEVTVRLHGRPEAVAAATCCFDDIDGAVRTVITTIQLGGSSRKNRTARRSAHRCGQQVLGPRLSDRAHAVLRVSRIERAGRDGAGGRSRGDRASERRPRIRPGGLTGASRGALARAS